MVAAWNEDAADPTNHDMLGVFAYRSLSNRLKGYKLRFGGQALGALQGKKPQLPIPICCI